MFFVLQISSAQNFQVIVKSFDNNDVQSGVLFYSNNKFLGQTDLKGEIKINLNLLDSIQLVKENFDDITLKASEISSIIFLRKLKVIELNEVKILNLNINQILDKVENSLNGNNSIYHNIKSFHYFNLLTVGTDTLHYLNDRMQFSPNQGTFINDQNKIIKKFYFDNGYLIYKLDNKKASFSSALNSRFTAINSKDGIVKILKNRNLYDFILNDSEEYYKITYKANKDKKYTYQGYIIIDKLDFGIYELEMKLLPNTDNVEVTYLFSEKENLSYSVNEEILFYSLNKVENEYVINWSSYDLKLTQKKGDFKGCTFINKFRIENTPNFIDEKTSRFNFVNYTTF